MNKCWEAVACGNIILQHIEYLVRVRRRALNRDIVIRDLIRDIVVCPSLSLSMTSQPSPLPPYYRNTQRERGRVRERERDTPSLFYSMHGATIVYHDIALVLSLPIDGTPQSLSITFPSILSISYYLLYLSSRVTDTFWVG
jgi:hypothetical protein